MYHLSLFQNGISGPDKQEILILIQNGASKQEILNINSEWGIQSLKIASLS
jgi:hypothetical protein